MAALAAPADAATIEHQVRAAFAPYGQSSVAACVAEHESHYAVAAASNGNYGIMQIAYRWHHNPGEREAAFARRMYRPAENLALAVRIYRDARRRWGNGWLPWSTRVYCGA